MPEKDKAAKAAPGARGEKGAKETKGDWSDKIAGRIVGFVGAVREKISKPFRSMLTLIASLPIILLAVAGLIVLGTMGLFRLADAYLPFETWAAHLIFGAFFTALGLILWPKRYKSESSELE